MFVFSFVKQLDFFVYFDCVLLSELQKPLRKTRCICEKENERRYVPLKPTTNLKAISKHTHRFEINSHLLDTSVRLVLLHDERFPVFVNRWKMARLFHLSRVFAFNTHVIFFHSFQMLSIQHCLALFSFNFYYSTFVSSFLQKQQKRRRKRRKREAVVVRFMRMGLSLFFIFSATFSRRTIIACTR